MCTIFDDLDSVINDNDTINCINLDIFPTKIYDTIVIDPPWPVKKLTHKDRPNQTTMDYKTMSVQEISKLPIAIISHDDCWLFLWTTQKFIFDAKNLLEKWGFNYLLTMVWEKTFGKSSGMALYGFRWNAEFILVGTKGKKDTWPSTSLIPVVFQAENFKHSQKPSLFYKMIEPLGTKRIDLFARRNRQNWDTWGD